MKLETELALAIQDVIKAYTNMDDTEFGEALHRLVKTVGDQAYDAGLKAAKEAFDGLAGS